MLCRVLGVSTSGYYAWRSREPSVRTRQDSVLTEEIVRIHQASRLTCGAPRIQAELVALGRRHSRKRVARLMRAAGVLEASIRRVWTRRRLAESVLRTNLASPRSAGPRSGRGMCPGRACALERVGREP
jgi:transposase InsO family protein